MAKDNNLLGKFELTNIPPAPRGVPQIEVTFGLDANGLITVSAADKGTGKSESITIKNDRGRLSKEDIDRMVEEAEKYASQDAEVKAKIEAKNSLENYAHSLKNQASDENALGGKIDEDEKETLIEAANDVLEWLEDNEESASKEDLEEKYESLTKVAHPITQKLYGAQAGEDSEEEEDDDYFDHDEL